MSLGLAVVASALSLALSSVLLAVERLLLAQEAGRFRPAESAWGAAELALFERFRGRTDWAAACWIGVGLLQVASIAPPRLAGVRWDVFVPLWCCGAALALWSGLDRALRRPRRRSRLGNAAVRLALVLLVALSPLARLLGTAVRRFLRLCGAATPRVVSEEEILTGIELGGDQGVLREEEGEMLEGVLGLEETAASEVMTPRVDLVGVSLDGDTDEWVRTARSVRVRHLPVYRGNIDTIVGMLDVVRFLLDPAHDRDAATIPPLCVPESIDLGKLLVLMQRQHSRCAVVLDEYGGTAGLVTRGDILEEITPDVEGEYAAETPPIEALGGDAWLVDGRVSLDDLNDELGLSLASEAADRISGWVAEHADRVPRVGERVEAQGCRATVRRLRKNRVVQVQLERVRPRGAGDEADAAGEDGA